MLALVTKLNKQFTGRRIDEWSCRTRCIARKVRALAVAISRSWRLQTSKSITGWRGKYLPILLNGQIGLLQKHSTHSCGWAKKYVWSLCGFLNLGGKIRFELYYIQKVTVGFLYIYSRDFINLKSWNNIILGGRITRRLACMS